MKLKYKMSVMDMNGELTAVPMGKKVEYHGILQMNETTAFILELLKKDTTEEKIAAAMLEEYDATPEQIRESVDRVLTVLRNHKLLEE